MLFYNSRINRDFASRKIILSHWPFANKTFPFSANEVRIQLEKLDWIKKATGMDDLQCKSLFNLSIAFEGTVSTEWKLAWVTPIFK